MDSTTSLSVHLQHVCQACLALGGDLIRLLLVFVGRHWLVGLANAGVTVLAGLGILWLASHLWPLRTRPALVLQARRLVYLVALFKGALYLTIGDSLIFRKQYGLMKLPIGYGVQLPPPPRLDFFDWEAHFSIWHPTSATVAVTLISCGVALTLLVLRAYRVAASCKVLVSLDQLYNKVDQRTEDSLRRAASALNLPSSVGLPKILLVDVQCATPLLLGVRQPRLLLSPRLLAMLSDDELELALRHELAHLKRRDHWWRWIQLWIEDVGRPILFINRLSAGSVELEEMLCDRTAVKSSRDALSLANAITKAAQALKYPQENLDSTPGLTDSVVPALLGKQSEALREQSSLKRRIGELLRVSQEYAGGSAGQVARSSRLSLGLSLCRLLTEIPVAFLLALILFGVLYAKFYLILNLQ